MGFSVSTTKFVFFGLLLVPSVQMVRGCGPSDSLPPQPLSVGEIRDYAEVESVEFDDYLADGLDYESDSPGTSDTNERAPGALIAYTLSPQPGENIGHYLMWTGFEKEELMKQMGLSSARELRADRRYSIQLTPRQVVDFERRRQQRITDLRERFFNRYTVKDYASYTVIRGDSPDRISSRSKVPLWLVVEANRGINLGRIHPSDVIQLPVVVEKTNEISPVNTGSEVVKLEEKPATASPVVLVPEEKPQVSSADFARRVASFAVEQRTTSLTISIMRGESLSYLAGLADISVSKLIEFNGIENPDRIQIGDKIKLPISTDRWADVLKARKDRGHRSEAIKSYKRRGFEIRTIQIRRGDTLSELARSLGADKGALKILNPRKNLNRVSPGDEIRFAVRPQPEPTVQNNLEGI
jgi:LysM repeat protein